MFSFLFCKYFTRPTQNNSTDSFVILDTVNPDTEDAPTFYYWKIKKQKYHGLCGWSWEYTKIKRYRDVEYLRLSQEMLLGEVEKVVEMKRRGWIMITEYEFNESQ